MASTQSNDIFNVFRGTEEQITNISATPIRDGQVYFAYDKDETLPRDSITASKLYFDANSHRFVVAGGGDISFIKAHPAEPPEEDEDYFYIFNKNDIDAHKVNTDNILITDDDVLYRVIKISADGQTIYTHMIAGGGGGGSADNNPLSITWIEDFPKRCIITKTPTAKIRLNSRVSTVNRGVFTVYCNGKEVTELSNTTQAIAKTDVQLIIPLKYLEEGTNNIIVTLSASGYTFQSEGAVVMFRAEFSPKESWNSLRVFGTDNATIVSHNIVYQYNFTGLSNGRDDTLVQGRVKAYIDDELIKTQNTWGEGQLEIVCGTDPGTEDIAHGNHTLRYDSFAVVDEAEYPVHSYSYDIIWATAEGGDKPIIISSYNENAEEENYNIIHIPYMVYQKGKEISELHQYINGEELPTSPIEASYNTKADSYDVWNISKYEVEQDQQPNVFILRVDDVQREFNVTILPSQLNLDATKDRLLLYLTAKERSNKESLTSRKTWEFKKDENTTYSAIFENFNWYNNGWQEVALEDDEIQRAIEGGMSRNEANQLRTTVLRLTNGAKVTIPFAEILQNQLPGEGFTIEVEFKCRNALNYAKLLTLQNVEKPGQENVPEEDKEYEVVKNIQYDEHGNVANAVGTYFNNSIGFAFGTQEAFFASDSKIVNVRYADNDKVKVSVVADAKTSFLYVYINGVLSGVEHWPDNNSFAAATDAFVFNSDYCDLDLYNIRVYDIPLTFDGIVQNWVGDASTLETKLSRYEENNITRTFEIGTTKYATLDYDKTVALSKTLGDRYIAANRPVGMQKGMPIMVISTYGDDKLPYAKGTKTYCDIRFWDPNGEVPAVSGKELFGFKCRNIELDVQGTSSQGYPRRNYKAKIKAAKKTKYTDIPFELDTWDGDDTKRNIWSDNEEAFSTTGYETMKKIDIGNGIAETTFCFKADFMDSSSSHNTPLANYIQELYTVNMGLRHPLSALLNSSDNKYRTTVYGFPMLIFHEKKGSTEPIEFVGRYNFNIDKGATTSFGFTVEEPHSVLHALKDREGNVLVENPTYADVAECWELKSNMHGFTGFRRKDFDTIIDNRLDFYNFFENRYSKYDFDPDDMYDEDTSVNKQDTNNALWEYMKNIQALSEWIYSTDVHPWDTNDLTDIGTHKLSAHPVSSTTALKYNIKADTNAIELLRDYYIYNDDTHTKVTCVNDWFNGSYDGESNYVITVTNPNTGANVQLNTIYEDEINAVLDTPVKYITRDTTWDARIITAEQAAALSEEARNALQKDTESTNYIQVNKTYYLGANDDSAIPTAWYHVNQIMAETQAVDSENNLPLYVKAYDTDGSTVLESTTDVSEALTRQVQEVNADGDKLWVKTYDEDGVTVLETTANEAEALKVEGVAVPATYDEPIPVMTEIVQSEEIIVREPGSSTPIDVATVYEKFERDTKNYRLSKYHAEFSKHLNFNFCAAYFLLTELFIMYDSREKNMMIASWGPEEEGGDYIWYPIFYDMDTQLGINNSGTVYWDYDVNAQDSGIFSGAGSVLWDNFYACFLPEIKNFYIKWRKENLTVNNCIKYYNTKSADTWTPIMKNADAFYKYIAPTIDGLGYISKDDGEVVLDSVYGYLYCAQGDRSLNRAAFFRNRFNYKDSEWLGGAYRSQGGENIEMRYDANWTGTSDPNASNWAGNETAQNERRAAGLDATAYFNITPYLTQYVSVYYDEIPRRSEGPDNSRYDIQNPPASGYIQVQPLPAIQDTINKGLPLSQQLVYINGPSYLRDIGDLSTKYLDRLTLGTAIRLNRLVLGNDHPLYRNDGATSDSIRIESPYRNGNTLNPNAKALLEYLDLSNLSGMRGGLDVTGCLKLKTVRLLGSSLSSITLPEGNVVETLYLPRATEDFVLIQGQRLTDVIRDKNNCITLYAPNHQPVTGLYIENVTDEMDVEADADLITQYMGINVPISGISVDDTFVRNNIKKYQLQSGVLGFNSYEILDHLVKTKIKMNLAPQPGDKLNLMLRLLDVNWSPYTLLDEDAVAVDGVTYYIRNSNNTYSPLPQDITFEYAKQNLGGVYNYDETKVLRYNETTNKHGIPDLNILKLFIKDYQNEEKTIVNGKYIFRDTYEFGRDKFLPHITGEIYVDNDTPIDEYELYTIQELYNSVLTLNDVPLTICAKNVTDCKRAQFIEVIDNIQHTLATYRSQSADELVFPDSTKKIADCTRTHYDFRGWVSKTDAIAYGLDTFVNENGVPLTDTNSIVLKDSEILNHLVDLDTLTYGEEPEIYYAVYTLHEYKMTYILDEELYAADPTNPKAYEECLVPSGSMVSTNPAVTIPWKTSPTQALLMMYVFKGWAYKNESNPRDLSRIRAQSDLTFYPVFVEDSVYNNPIPAEYIDYIVYNNQAYLRGVTKHFGGKVCIPNYIDDYPIVSIVGAQTTNGREFQAQTIGDQLTWDKSNGFQGNNDITHIFFQGANNGSSKIIELNEYCFSFMEYLLYLDMPQTLTTFRQCCCWTDRRLSFANLTYAVNIGRQAFAVCNGVDDTVADGQQAEMQLFIKANPGLVISGYAFSQSGWRDVTIGTQSEPWDTTSLADDIFVAGATTYRNSLSSNGVRKVVVYFSKLTEADISAASIKAIVDHSTTSPVQLEVFYSYS